MKNPRNINKASRFVSFLAGAAALLASTVCFAQPQQPTAVPPPVGVVQVQPYGVCPGTSQGQLCDNNAWVTAQRAAELARPAPPAAETAEARRTRQQQCIATICNGESGDSICTCACRDAYFSMVSNSCRSLASTVDGNTAVAINHEARITELERRAGVSSTRASADSANVRSRIRARQHRQRRHH